MVVLSTYSECMFVCTLFKVDQVLALQNANKNQLVVNFSFTHK